MHRTITLSHWRPLLTVMLVVACTDARSPDTALTSNPPAPNVSRRDADTPRGLLGTYVAIGTSVSMGIRSDGLLGSSQRESWPAQLAQMANAPFTQPLIQAPGCTPPLAAPLALGRRTDGSFAGLSSDVLPCAALEAGVALPTQNLAIQSLTTLEALTVTPELMTDPKRDRLFDRVLPPGGTVISSMLAQHPTFVSVEFGANEVLEARRGIAVVGQTIFPVDVWRELYSAVVDSVRRVARRGVLVGLVKDVGDFPSFRYGSELWNDRAAFMAFNVAIADDCQDSQNLVFVPVAIPTAAGTGAAYAENGLGPAPFSCADRPGTQDYILTPSEARVVNVTMRNMTRHIRELARREGFAFFALEALYGRTDLEPTYSVVAQLTSDAPYGPLISLDGLHPSAAGHTVLANAAARAIRRRFGIPLPIGTSDVLGEVADETADRPDLN